MLPVCAQDKRPSSRKRWRPNRKNSPHRASGRLHRLNTAVKKHGGASSSPHLAGKDEGSVGIRAVLPEEVTTARSETITKLIKVVNIVAAPFGPLVQELNGKIPSLTIPSFTLKKHAEGAARGGQVW